jgi:prolyl 4-hydroxylase
MENEPASPKLASTGKSVRRQLGKLGAQVEKLGINGIELYAVRHFLRPFECAELIRQIDQVARPSTLYVGTEIDGFRTSFSGDLNPGDPLVTDIDARLSALTGIDKRHGEALQGQRYTAGQRFGPHHDWFHTDQSYWEEERRKGGQRSWTGMIYLNRPEAGGETAFVKFGVLVSAEPGMLLLWNNADQNGAPNPLTLHEGCPVEAGAKYVVTKWYRERFWLGLALPSPNAS